jgi:sulfate adenylyltransferase large subunit
MTAHPIPSSFGIDTFLRQQRESSLLRFVACGSVDHGKSTLIGRLLYEAKLLLEDQLDALKSASRKSGTQGEDLDFSLLLDGLAAELEQKITIDVAYRFFSTDRRKFIVADAPGHEQYTRNMATGASTADLALILVSADSGLTRQTKRHSLIVSMLGVRHLVLAVNKMDLVGFSEAQFRKIEQDFKAFGKEIGVEQIVCIPMAAVKGDNVVARSRNMDWYKGPTLLDHLEQVDVTPERKGDAFRMSVQWVNRPNAGFRGYSGIVSGGDVFPGMAAKILPSGRETRVARIVTMDGDLNRATVGQSVTLVLEDDVDASRGDVIAHADRAPAIADRFDGSVFWMATEPLTSGREYLLKLGSCTVTAKVAPGIDAFDFDTQRSVPAERLATNEVGRCTLQLDRMISVDPYVDCKDTGSFILIDPESYDTIGMGIVGEVLEIEQKIVPVSARDAAPSDQASAVEAFAAPVRESRMRSLAKAFTWRTTGSLDTFIIAWIITGRAVWAGGIASVELVTKIFLYYFHERIWSWVRWGRK